MKIELMHLVGDCEGLLPECSQCCRQGGGGGGGGGQQGQFAPGPPNSAKLAQILVSVQRTGLHSSHER